MKIIVLNEYSNMVWEYREGPDKKVIRFEPEGELNRLVIPKAIISKDNSFSKIQNRFVGYVIIHDSNTLYVSKLILQNLDLNSDYIDTRIKTLCIK